MDETIEALKKLAYKHYEDGGDRMIECWDKADFAEFLEECNMYQRDPFVVAKELFSVWDEQRKQATMWIEVDEFNYYKRI